MFPTAVLVDGSYFLKRYGVTYGPRHSPDQIAKTLFTMCISHLDEKNDLYRIFFYDCPPLAKKAHHPITRAAIDFSKTRDFTFRTQLHKELVKQRKVALRLGGCESSATGRSSQTLPRHCSRARSPSEI